jgi:hypothetical protein
VIINNWISGLPQFRTFEPINFLKKKRNSLAVAGKLATGKEKTINHSIPFADPGW